MNLSDIAAVLGCSKPTASQLRSGTYDKPASDLPARYAALVRIICEQQGQDLHKVCVECPRQACDGCRVGDLIGQ